MVTIAPLGITSLLVVLTLACLFEDGRLPNGTVDVLLLLSLGVFPGSLRQTHGTGDGDVQDAPHDLLRVHYLVLSHIRRVQDELL